MNKYNITIFYNENQKSSILITQFIAEHMAALKQFCVLSFVNVNAKNSDLILQHGVRKIPTLACGKDLISEEKNIIMYLLNLRKKFQESLKRIPESFNLDDYAKRELETANKMESMHNGQKVKKYIWNDNEDENMSNRMYLDRVKQFKNGGTDFNKTGQERCNASFGGAAQRKSVVRYGGSEDDGFESSDDKFIANTSYFGELATEDDATEDFRKFASEELSKPIVLNTY